MSDPVIRAAIVTLGVDDLGRSAAFYEAMGLRRSRASQGDIVMFDMDGVVLALYPSGLLAEDAGVAAAGSGFRRQTLAWCLSDVAAVDAAFAKAQAVGGSSVKTPHKAFWGGYSGYFADPDGHLWEVVHNPFFPLDDTGAVSLPPPAQGPGS